MTYLYWFTIFIFIPTSLIWIIFRKTLFKYPRTIALSLVISAVISYFWDIWAIGEKVWVLNEEKLLGVKILSLPFEEYLYIIFVTLFSLSISLILKERIKYNRTFY